MLIRSKASAITNYRAGAADRDALRRITANVATAPIKENIANLIVRKPWGDERLLYEGRRSALWLLNLKPGHMTSMHCHRRKTTTLIVINGTITFRTLTADQQRSTGEGVWIGTGVFHQSEAGSDGATLLELETPVDKFDLVRLADAYGRQGTSYEGPENMQSSPLTTLQGTPIDGWRQQIGSACISIYEPTKPHTIPAARDFNCVLEGAGIDIEGYAVMGTGDCLEVERIGRRVAFWRPGSLIATISTMPASSIDAFSCQGQVAKIA